MGTNSADPGLLEHLAGAMEGRADDVESWGCAAANTMAGFGYAYGSTSAAGSTYGTAVWIRDWATSLRSRASLLSAYASISLMGSGGAGGAGAALAAGRQWALSEVETTRFEDWYAVRMAALADRTAGAQLASAMQAALASDDYAAAWDAISRLVALDSPEAAAGFFNRLGEETTAKLPNEVIGMTSMSGVYLRGTVGHPADLVSHLSRQLAAATHTKSLRFTGGELIEADLAADVFASRYFTGYGAEYLLVASGFDADFLADAVATYLPFHGNPVMAQQVLVSSLDGQLPMDPRDFLLPNVAAAGAGAELVLQLLDDVKLGALLKPRVSYEEQGYTAVAPILDQATVGLFTDDPVAAQSVIGSLIISIASGAGGGHLDIVATAILLVLPLLNGVTNGVSHQAWLGEPGGREVLVTEEDLKATLRRFAANDTASAALYEGILIHYGGMLAASDGDPSDLNRIAISLAETSSLLTTAIADGNISDAKERDERTAAVIGLIDTLAMLVPLPGATAVGSKFAVSVLKTTYGEFVDRGLALLGSNHEDAAREAADVFNAALLFSYTELLTLGHLHADGPEAVQGSIDEFFADSPHLDPTVYGFSDGAGGVLTELSERQTQAYGEWITFASATAEINDAISRMLAEFLQGLPRYDS